MGCCRQDLHVSNTSQNRYFKYEKFIIITVHLVVRYETREELRMEDKLLLYINAMRFKGGRQTKTTYFDSFISLTLSLLDNYELNWTYLPVISKLGTV